MKRLIDASAALMLLIVLSPLILLLAIGVWIDVGRPILFRQLRPGLGGEPFLLHKFRTMRKPHPGELEVDSDNDRLTAFGRFLRTTSLDELPELWNVLKGDMSLVGPRPLLMQYLPLYSPEQMRRHDVRPGLTGWAQVNGRNALSWEEKFRYDVWYVDHRSVMLDLRILLMTAKSLLTRSGISHGESATMPEFRGTAAGNSSGDAK
jgi:sugar transferase EpsL